MGRSLVEALRRLPGIDRHQLVAVGTNSIATTAMLRAGADAAATGENAILYNCRDAQFILGAIGIAFANSMYGEISPAMAAAVSASEALKLLLPNSKCSAQVIGVIEQPMTQYIAEAVAQLQRRLSEETDV